jgi:hypothetical protein
MAGYTKLFSSLIHSTIWREADHIRIVWITMLAMADRDGVVEASVPGLADASRVTLGQCREALASLSSPDPDSRTPDFEGRRIEQVDGGWVLLNHAKYREQLSREQKRAATAARVRKHRQEKRGNVTSDESNASGNAFGVVGNANVTPVTKSNASNAIPDASPSPSPTPDTKEEAAAETNRGGRRQLPGDVPCPSDLKLSPSQVSTLSIGIGIEQWAIDLMTTEFISSSQADPTDKRPLVAWSKCLSKAITGNWNSGKRPKKQAAEGERPSMTAEEAGIPL